MAAKAHGPPRIVFWFRRDLRLEDNHGLHEALRAAGPTLLPLFIFDRDILDGLPRQDARVEFIHNAVEDLRRKLGGRLHVVHGRPRDVFGRLLKEHNISAVYTNEDYEPPALTRDAAIRKLLEKSGVEFCTFKDQVIFSPTEVLKDDGSPYKVYGAYARKWRTLLKENPVKSFASANFARAFLKQPTAGRLQALPSLKALGFAPSGRRFPALNINKKRIAAYGQTRDLMGEDATTHLGLHLRFGTLSIRELLKTAIQLSDTFLSELIWREFFMQVLYHFPHSQNEPFDPRYAKIEWRQDEQQFRAWCEGRTGYPTVDAGMRELNETGFMHNRARMITASFLTKHLLIDWRKGERYFAEKLLDYDLAANVGNWQWAAGCGCDAAPYFRVFNPTLQQKRFDPQCHYAKRWIPEFGSVKYPEPIVDHEFARRRVLKVFGAALKEGRT